VSAELRRIVVSAPGRGVGTAVVGLVRELCKRDLGRQRVWLEVFESNERALHVYESCGFLRFGSADHEGRRLLLYEAMA
jgi:RimJ/RimL family protein N-acetyltransferase